jgi:hypothetical protein
MILCCRPSKSMSTVTGVPGVRGFSSLPSVDRLSLPAGAAFTPGSSSLSGSNGLAPFFLSTARYSQNVRCDHRTLCRAIATSGADQLVPGTTGTYRFLSQTGQTESAKPSVIWCFSPVSTLTTKIARYRDCKCLAWATYFESGLQTGSNVRAGTIQGSSPICFALPVATSRTQTFRLVSELQKLLRIRRPRGGAVMTWVRETDLVRRNRSNE